MAAQKPSIPKGTRDFGPAEMARREFLFDTIKNVFRLHGFQPLETPAMENLTTLLGKYGEEGDKLLFRIMNSGEKAGEAPEKGLRYDLTVPFARYVVQHQNDIVFPFRRYQVQPVWRADRPQKGRYREFYQCDVDIIGSRSLLNEVELVQMVERVFETPGIAVTLKLNNRKILAGIAETIGHADKMVDITVAIDKLDKIGMEAVEAELGERGIDAAAVARLRPILQLAGTPVEKLATLRGVLAGSETGLKGIEEMETIFRYVDTLGVKLPVELDLSLARGLNYYTGAIFEVKARDWEIGSICGGGRYDDLTGIFGMPDTSGVGISFGADRIYDVMVGLELFPEWASMATMAMLVNFGGEEELYALGALAALRESGVAAEIYPEAAKMKKQMEYAGRRGIPFVVIMGGDERAAGTATIREMGSGVQRTVAVEQIAEIILS
jgi:histidyl-tRNA synthetase